MRSMVSVLGGIALAATAPAANSPFSVPTANAFVFVIDTSGSMRVPDSDLLHPAVSGAIAAVVEANPQAQSIQFLDFDGRYMLLSGPAWIPAKAADGKLLNAVTRYGLPSSSDPAPGVAHALNDLRPTADLDLRMTIWILSDEYVGNRERTLSQIQDRNPHGSDSLSAVTINAIIFPTQMWSQDAQAAPKRYNQAAEELLREITDRYGGSLLRHP